MKNLFNFNQLKLRPDSVSLASRIRVLTKYVATLALFLCLGVGQMWATDYYLMKTDGTGKGTSLGKMTVSGSVASKEWTAASSPNGSKFYITTNPASDQGSSVDYLCGSLTFNESEQQLYLYGTSNYGDAVTLSCTQTGTYRFEFNTSTNKIRCFYPKTLLKPGKYIYFDAHSESNWTSASFAARFYFKYYDSNSDVANVWCAAKDTVEKWVYYAEIPAGDYTGKVQMNRYSAVDGTYWNNANVITASSRSALTQNCLVAPSSGWDGITLTWSTYAPPVKSIALSHNVSPSGGDGTAGTPYLVPTGTSVTVTATPTNISDPDITTSYKWDDGSYGSTATKVLNCSVGGNTYSTTVTCRNAISGTNSTTKSKTVYYQAVSDPTIVLTSVSSSALVEGESITLVAERANSEDDIVFQYSTNSGSTWTDIVSPSPTVDGNEASVVWPIPEAHGATRTFIFRAVLKTDDVQSDESDDVTVYGKKTIHVKNTDNWATFNSYVYDYSAGVTGPKREEWPGSTTGITSMGGQWKNVVLTSQYTYFILNDGSSTNQLKGETYTYASSVSDNGYYVIGGSGNQHTLSSSSAPTAPAAPSVSAATNLTNTTARINGSISATNGNDALTDYGFYWSNNGSYDTADKLKASGTKVQKGTSDFSGSIYANLTSLTAGNTIRYITYATNGQGTTLSSVQSFVVPYSVQVQKPTGCSSITPSAGDYYYSTGFTVTTVAATGYTFSSWSATNGSTSSAASPSAGTNTVTFTPTANSAVITPVYTENSYSTNVAVSPAGKGSISSPTPSEGKITVKQVTGTSVTASANTNYVFTNWSTSGGGLTVSSTTTNPATFKATAADGTITANFADQWNVKGSWDDWGDYTGMPATGVANTFGTTMTLAAKTEYHFKVVKRVDNNGSNDKWYGVNGGKTLTRASGSVTGLEENGGVDEYITFTTDAAGDYTITYLYNAAVGSMKVTVTYPTAYTMTFAPKSFYIGASGETSTTGGTLTAKDQTNASLSTGNKVKSGGSAVFTATKNTGYTFNGFFSDAACTSAYTAGAGVAISDNVLTLSSIGADKYVYAKFSENITTVNLVASPTGKGSFTKGGTPVTSVSAGVTTKPTVTAVAGTGYRLTGTIWSESSDYISISPANTASTTITATGTSGNTATLTATFTPITYTIAFNANGGSGTMTNQTSVAYDSETTIKSNTFTRTGYNFAGWATSAGGDVVRADGAAHGNLSNTQGATVTLFAQWTPKQSALTLNYQDEVEGYASDGSISNTEGLKGTYGSAMTALTGTMPTADPGYAFMGFYDATGGGGTKYYNADGSSAHNWDKDTESGTTLYAHWVKAVFTSLEHASSIAKAAETNLVVNPVLNVTPENYIAICWTLHYTENDNEVATSGESYYSVSSHSEGGKPNQVRFTLHNLSVGSYYVKAVLKAKASEFSSACSEGNRQDSTTSEFSIVGSSTVTVRYMDDSGNVIASSGSVEIEAGSSAGIKAPNIIGYTFHEWSLGAGVTNTCASSANCDESKDSINISSPYDGVVTIFYTKKKMIYFNNTLGWNDVYIYFYNTNKYWSDDTNEHGSKYGSGANKDKVFDGDKKPYWEEEHGHMTQIEGTNIWYFDYTSVSIPDRTNITFTKDNQHNYDYFYATEVVRVCDAPFNGTTLTMYVPLASPTESYNTDAETEAKYYTQGYWMNYPDSTGYKLKIYNGTGGGATLLKEKEFSFNAGKKMPMSVIVDLEAGRTYGFKIYRVGGTWYSNANTMSNGHSGDEGQTVWEFTTGVSNNCGLQTTSAGDYTFTLNFGQDNSSNYNYLVGVRYPESTGDYRVLYKDNTHTNWLASKVIPKNSETDTISYFVRSAGSPQMKLQKCTATWNGSSTTVTWEDTVTNLISSLPSVISSNGNGVYYFCLNKNAGTGVRELGDTKQYTGNFYIRVDGAGSTNWDNFRASDHIMPFSEYSFAQTTDPYSHYYTKFYRTVNDNGTSAGKKNIKFVVANDYSVNISDTIIQDGIGDSYVDANGDLDGRNANIRFMYNYKTNVATRRYLDGAQGPGSDDFLLLIPSNNTSIYDAQTGGSPYTQVKFTDKNNWIYEADVYVVPGTEYQLKSNFGTDAKAITQYLKGNYSGGVNTYETLIGGSGSSRLKIRLIYDFKTNRVISAYVPSGTIDANLVLNADIMFERVHQGNVTQITFGENKSISEITNVYTTLKFDKDEINNPALSRYERDLFYVSFPYNVRVSDIIGFGTYGKHWIIEYYDGAARAEKGFWSDSKSFWTFVTPDKASSFVMKAGTGYIVALDLDELTPISSVWDNSVTTVELIFPGDISSISNQEVIYNMPSHQCNINRGTTQGDRRIKDSHWNVLGVPAYHNTTGSFANHSDVIGEETQVWSAENAPKYLYTWNMTDNSLTITNASGYNYKAMNAYIVQYYGDVTFRTSTNAAPASVAARTYADAPRSVDFRLEIQQNETTIDQTFVQLSDEEGVSSEFVFGEDMSKEFNKNKANIYTMITSVLNDTATVTEAAGNTLPMSEQTTVVPVGVKIVADGEYTFAIPDGTSGVGVTLIDNVLNTRTNLGLTDYTVNLTAGTIDGRFVLEISPVQGTTTSLEPISDEGLENSGVRKVIIDQKMYIVKGDRIYDATGALVK